MAVLRARRGFGVILHAERRAVGEFKAAIAAVEQANMRRLRVGGKGRGVDREAVVHGCYLDRAVAEPLDRMVRAAVAWCIFSVRAPTASPSI